MNQRTEELEARVERRGLFGKLEKLSEGVVVGLLENEDVAIDESTHLEENESVGGKVDPHQRHHRNELEGVDQSPH